MHKIYFDDRSVTICGIPETEGFHPVDISDADMEREMTELAENFKAGMVHGDVTLRCTEPDEAYRIFCSCFKEVNAAGGVVTDKEGNFLLIKRNSLWDLPKGHQEPGEDISITALREVEEETGADGLVLGDLLCITDHCYLRDGIIHLKHTWWYSMEASCGPLSPQTEEGISEVVLVSATELEKCLENTFPSIRDIFKLISDSK